MSADWIAPSRRAWSFLALLLVLGVLGNQLKIGLLLHGLDFIFGSIAVLLVLRLYGIPFGLLASLAASSCTPFTWGHPCAMVTFTLETLFVALFLRSGRTSLLLADALFWAAVGIPAVIVQYYFFLHIDFATCSLIFLKQSINGIFNALVASLLLNHLPLYRLSNTGRDPRTVSLKETLFNLLVALVLLPAIFMTVQESRHEKGRIERDAVAGLETLSTDMTNHLAAWYGTHMDALRELAARAERFGTVPSAILQDDTRLLNRSQPSFYGMYIANADGVSVAASPEINDQGEWSIGMDYSDRSYFRDLKRTEKPVASGVFTGRGGVVVPTVVIAVPVFRDRQFDGYAAGAVNLEQIRKILEFYHHTREVRITLVDAEGRVIASTDPARNVKQPFVYREKGPAHPVAGSVFHRLPESKYPSNMVRWEHSSFSIESVIFAECPWKIVLEAPVSTQMRALYAEYLRNFLTMAGFAVLAILIAAVLSRWVTGPLERLARATEDVPVRLSGGQSIEFPESSAAELHSLAGNFQSMFQLLRQNFQALQERGRELTGANEALKKEVACRARAQEALAGSEEKYRELVENSNTIILRLDAQGDITFFNEYAQKFFGYAEEDIIGRNVAGTIAPIRDASEDVLEWIVRDVFVCPPDDNCQEAENMLRNGERVWISWKNTIVYDETGEISAIHCVGYDVTDRKKAERALRETKEMLQALIEASPMGIDVLDETGRVVLWNPAAEAIYGWSEDEILGRRPPMLTPEEDSELHRMLQRIFEGKAQKSVERNRLRKDGSRIDISLSVAPLRDSSGKVVAVMGIFADIGERKRAEEERNRLQELLRHAQKMEAIGTLAGGIAHDFNNILGAIIGYTEIALNDTARWPSIQSDLQQVLKAALRARDLIRQILTFSRDQSDRRKIPVEIGAIVKETAKFLRASIPSTIDIRHSVPEEPCTALADPTQIHQVLLNLCANAAGAMEEGGGTLTISLAAVTMDSAAALEYPNLQEGRYIRLSVGDNGQGIDAAIIEHIFEPYFTTKEVGKGSGLGLAVVHGIVKSHGGAISVRSRPGEGSTFDVFFPGAEIAPRAEAPAADPVPGGSESILFVDDEEMLVEMGRKMLERLGYRVTAVRDGRKALEIFRRDPRAFDLVITDYAMPRMTGEELARAILETRADIPVLLATGFNQRISLEQARRIGVRDLLLKPVTLRNMAEAVRLAVEKG